jgi:hypothetical protein
LQGIFFVLVYIYIYKIPYKPPHGRVAGGVRTPAVFKFNLQYGMRRVRGGVGEKLCVSVLIERMFNVCCDRVLCVDRMSSCIYLFGNVSL